MPGVTEEMLARVMGADMDELRRRGEAICALLDGGAEARITCANGSDLRLGLEGRSSIVDAGDLSARGAFGNLPCGEGFIAPLEGTGEGTLVVDGSIAGVGLLEEPVPLTVRDGHLTDADGADGRGAARAAHRARAGRHQRRRARDRHQRRGDPDRQHPRGREDPRHRPRRLRRLGGDRRHRPGPGPPRLRRPRADGRDRRRAARPRRRAARLSVPTLLAVPNVSEGRDAAGSSGSRPPSPRGAELLDRHADADHDRTVFTLAGEPGGDSAGRLLAGAEAAIEAIDMAAYRGLHPAIGALDVCPVVWLDAAATATRRRDRRSRVAERIGALGVPVFLYGELAAGARARERAYFRNGGLAELWLRMESGELRPDHGPAEPHPSGRRDPGHRPPAARRLQRRARQRRRRGRPRGRRRAARVRRRPARRAGDRAALAERPRPGLDQRPRPARDAARRRRRAGAGAGRAARRPAGRGRARRPAARGGARRLSGGRPDPRLRPRPAHDRAAPGEASTD